MPALRPRERRLLILAALIAIGVAGYVYVVEPLVEAHAATQELPCHRERRGEALIACRYDKLRPPMHGGYARNLVRWESIRRQGMLPAPDPLDDPAQRP